MLTMEVQVTKCFLILGPPLTNAQMSADGCAMDVLVLSSNMMDLDRVGHTPQEMTI